MLCGITLQVQLAKKAEPGLLGPSIECAVARAPLGLWTLAHALDWTPSQVGLTGASDVILSCLARQAECLCLAAGLVLA